MTLRMTNSPELHPPNENCNCLDLEGKLTTVIGGFEAGVHRTKVLEDMKQFDL